MKVTKEYLKKLIREQIEQEVGNESEGEAGENLQQLKQKLLDIARDLKGIQSNEFDLVNFFIDMIEASKNKNLNISELRRKLGMAKAEVEKAK